jgi:hypothetical protein
VDKRAGNPVMPRQRMSSRLVSLTLSLVSSRVLGCGVTAGAHAPSTTSCVCGNAQNSLQVGMFECFGVEFLALDYSPPGPPSKGC